MSGPTAWLLAWLIAINVTTATLYAYDKAASRHRWRRVRERTLKLGCLLGGVAGAWVVFLGLRHKTRHLSFWAVQGLASAMWAGILLAAAAR